MDGDRRLHVVPDSTPPAPERIAVLAAEFAGSRFGNKGEATISFSVEPDSAEAIPLLAKYAGLYLELVVSAIPANDIASYTPVDLPTPDMSEFLDE